MTEALEGTLDGKGLRIGVVSARFNDFIVDHLERGAMEGLRQCDVRPADVHLVRVPGSFELPLAAMRLAESGSYDAIICLGCVIRGATSHYDLVCAEAAKGVAGVSQKTGVPAIFSVVTTDTIEQAIERSGAKMGNKGYDGALTAVEMANLLKQIGKGVSRSARKKS
ncbi:MAG: 6,7-dimethyl-8-ribityllumazine synthase [bacterium]|nr:6,7-dimethyl-8-ribityllumazine synthase [bacterium]